MANTDMKISQFPLIESVDGSEQLAIVKDGANGKMKTSAIIAKARGGLVPQVTGKGLSANDYTDADKAKLTELPTSTQLTEKIDEAKLALFVNLWNAAWTTDGKYDPQNAPDSQHPFMGNGLWFTFAEALRIYDSWLKVGKSNMIGAYTGAIQAGRTVIPPAHSYSSLDMSSCFNDSINLEVFVTRMCVIGNLNYAFIGCTKLTTVKIHTLEYLRSAANCFAGCSSLTTVELSRLNLSISFADSPLLSLSSMQYLVSKACNTTEITVTVHPDVYAKLTGDTTNAAASALTEAELAQWQALVATAGAKQITFATT